VAGVVTEVKVWEGGHVQRGDLLFQLDSRVADVAAAFAQKTLDRQQELLRLNNTSQRAVQDAEQQLAAARAQQELLRIRAPLAGTVTQVNVRPGEAVDLTTVLASITDLGRLVVTAEIPAAQAGLLKAGQKLDLQSDPPAESAVSYVSPGIQASNGTVEVRAPVPASSGLRPGQFTPLRIVTVVHADCLAAPAASIVKNTEGQEVLAVVTNDQAVQVPVKTGLRENGWVEVEGPGLAEGATVVTVGAYGLPEKTKIQIKNP
jgi:membrane fusion protein, multidrug efflux system